MAERVKIILRKIAFWTVGILFLVLLWSTGALERLWHELFTPTNNLIVLIIVAAFIITAYEERVRADRRLAELQRELQSTRFLISELDQKCNLALDAIEELRPRDGSRFSI